MTRADTEACWDERLPDNVFGINNSEHSYAVLSFRVMLSHPISGIIDENEQTLFRENAGKP